MAYALSISQPSAADLDIIHPFLEASYWSPGIPRPIVERSCANSICILAREAGGALIGFARLITDKATFAYLCDVFVLPAHQGRGIARNMIHTLRSQPDLQGFKRWVLGTRDAHGVYASVGFVPLGNPERFMEIRDMNPYGKGAV